MPASSKKFQPEESFVGFFQDNSELRNEFCPWIWRGSGTIICADRCSGAKKLLAE